MTATAGLVAVIADVGGHANDLERILDDLRGDLVTEVIPDGLTVVRVGA